MEQSPTFGKETRWGRKRKRTKEAQSAVYHMDVSHLNRNGAAVSFVRVFSSEISDSDFNGVVQYMLNSCNEKINSENAYNSAKIINAHLKFEYFTIAQMFVLLEVTGGCNNSKSCEGPPLICELAVREDRSTRTKEVLTDKVKCAKKEFEPVLPTSGLGFIEENVTNEIRSIAAFAVQQAEKNNEKRSVIDIMSVKRQVVGNATTLYLTLKVTRAEGGDAMQFEVCEAEMNQTKKWLGKQI
ncbi:hypothetical protein L9F63_013619 [Diploptera punctata]|uniref:Cystatin domain-containing protein n=1 Tax=Diploptera punctata TaxID=6984 RepID=A0AAD8ELX7_DIPPU|nr:hypothetical protein L9F63_013619 [Diploptera punctata]